MKITFVFIGLIWLTWACEAHSSPRETQIATTVLRKIQLGKEITGKRTIPVSSLPSSYSANEDISSLYPYTASEGQLKIRLGENYVPIVDIRNPTPALRKNVEAEIRLSKKIEVDNRRRYPDAYGMSPADVEKFAAEEPDLFFKEQLTKALEKERFFDPHWMVLYHGVGGEIGFLYDVFTELRQILTSQYYQNRHVLRVYDKIFQGIDSVLDFEKKLDSDPAYSAKAPPPYGNFFLFGSPESGGSSTVEFFYKGSSNPQDIHKFFHDLELQFSGLKLDPHKYLALYEKEMKIPPRTNSRFYQLFIHPDYINTLVSTAGAAGQPLRQLNYSALKEALGPNASKFREISLGEASIRSCEGRVSKVVSLMPTSSLPKEFIQAIKFNPTLSNEVLGLEKTEWFFPGVSTLQARLFTKPECMHNSEIVQTFMYPRLDDQGRYKKFLTALRKALTEDVASWLLRQNKVDSEAAVDFDIEPSFRRNYEQQKALNNMMP